MSIRLRACHSTVPFAISTSYQPTPLKQTSQTPNHEPALLLEFPSQVDQAKPFETIVTESNTVNGRCGKVQPSHLRANKRITASVQIRASQRIA